MSSETIHAHGYGHLEGPEVVYDGEWQNGLWHGKGVLAFSNGERYAGEFTEGKFSGSGSYSWPDGSEYVGDFADNKRNGNGMIIYANGDQYVGGFLDGKRHGQGTYTWMWNPKGTKIDNIMKAIDGTRNVGEWQYGEEWNITKFDRTGKVIGIWQSGVYRNSN